jgi:hypothetical protein
MRKLITACAASLLLTGCVTRDLCSETYRPRGTPVNQEWEASFRMCRMMDASIKYGTPVLRVEIQ